MCFVADAWSAPFPSLDSPSTLVLAFAAPAVRHRAEGRAALAALVAAYPTSVVIGCSTAGEIDHTEVRDDSITVAIAKFAHTRVRRAFARLGAATDSFAAGAALADKLCGDQLRAVIVLSEGLHVNGSELVRGLTSVLPPEVAITGGLAGDGARFGETWILDGATPESSAAVAVGLYGSELRVSNGSQGGWDAFGPERIVTAATGNVLHALDGRPALPLYKEYLGERAAELPGSALLFPLALRPSKESPHALVRTVLSVDEATQSMTFAGDLPVGHRARLMRANLDRLILGAQSAGLEAAHDPMGAPALAIAISCVGRRIVLGQRSEEEVEATLDALPPGTTQVGFYSYGEIAPNGGGACDLHNQTMTLTVLSEPR